jgi:antitoxin component of MazEF toxin-antitoxin module
VKLQRVFAYNYGDKPHYKYLITLPEKSVEELGWKEGTELEESVKDDRLILTNIGFQRKKASEEDEEKMSYDEFKEKIQKELKANPEGLTWTEIKQELKLPQKVPNNKWVTQMQSDIGLLRVKDARGTVWKLEK